MANICSTCYYIEGRKTTLKRIEKACNETDYEKDILRALGIKKLDNRYLRGDVLDTDFRGEARAFVKDIAGISTDEEIEAFNNSEDSEGYIYLHEIEIC